MLGLRDQLPQLLALGIQVPTVFEHVGHAGAEDARACAGDPRSVVPLERLAPVLLAEEAARRFRSPYLLPDALRERFCVAVLASGADALASPPR